MKDPNQAIADQLIANLPAAVKSRLKSVFREHGRNRHAMRASAKIIRAALKAMVFERDRAAARERAREERAIETARRIQRRGGRPLPGMTAERFQQLLAIDMAGAVASEQP